MLNSIKKIRVIGVLMATLAATACVAPPPRAPAQQAAAPTAAPVIKQELVVGTPADTFRVDGDRANLGMFPINTNVYETLVRMTPDFQVEPALAEKWEFRGENTWRFMLRQGVTFHDGQPFNAEAVKFSLGRLARIGGGALRVLTDSVTIVDAYTVDIKPTSPNLRLVDQLVHPSVAPMVAPNSNPGEKPIGTGPFKFVEYVKGERFVVERNTEYWGDKAKLDKITFRFFPDENTRWLALSTGEVDMIYDLPRQLVSEAKATQGIKLGITPPGASEIMLLNHKGTGAFTLLGDRAVRQALGYAIDRKTLIQQIWGDGATADFTMSPSAIFGANASLVQTGAFDPTKAKALLDGAGWKPGADGIREKDGKRLSLTMVNGYPPIGLRKPMPEFVQAQLKDVGVEINIVETPELATYLERLKNGEGDIFLERVAQNDANPAFFAGNFFYSKAAGDYAKWFAAGDAYDKLLEAARAAPERAEAMRNAADAMHIAIDEEAVVLPIAGVNWLFAMKDDVQGFVLHGSARHVRWASVSRGP